MQLRTTFLHLCFVLLVTSSVAAQSDDPAFDEPPDSGKEFTIWGAEVDFVDLKLWYKSRPSDFSIENYRLVIQTTEDVYYAGLQKTGFGESKGKLTIGLMTLLHEGGAPLSKGARIHIEKTDLRPNSRATVVSNYLRVKPADVPKPSQTASNEPPKPIGNEVARDPTHPDYVAENWKLIQQLEAETEGRGKKYATVLRRLAKADAKSVSREQRKKLAIFFRDKIEDMDRTFPEIELPTYMIGLVNWAGKYAAPTLVTVLDSAQSSMSPLRMHLDAIVKSLGDTKNPVAIDSLAEIMSSSEQFGSMIPPHVIALCAESLAKMGPEAEAALLTLAPSNSADVSRAAIDALGKVGTQKSLSLLRQAESSSNPLIRERAKAATKKIRQRNKAAKAGD